MKGTVISLGIINWQSTANFYKVFFEEKLYLNVLDGLQATLLLTAIATVIGLLIGLVIATIQIIPFSAQFKLIGKILKKIAVLYIDIIRGTPAVVQIFFLYMVVFAKSSMHPLLIGGLAFGINSGAYMSELVRAGIQGIDKGQMEAGRSLGINYATTMRYVILPQAFKNVLPALVSEFIILIKETAIIGFIGGYDLMRSSDNMMSTTFNATQPLLIVACIYLLLTSTFTRIMRKVEKKVRLSD
ncbi:MAG TPA: amino acid ABC transporter permease [Epulopiscium sp.]|nr:amino acid ABC transporter permease [Candidatus Epulonipiscium sp.]